MSVSLSAAAAASNETPPGAAGLVAGVMAVQVTTTLSSRARFSLVEITMRQSGVTFVRVASNSRNRALAAEISTGSAAETSVTVPVMAPFCTMPMFLLLTGALLLTEKSRVYTAPVKMLRRSPPLLE